MQINETLVIGLGGIAASLAGMALAWLVGKKSHATATYQTLFAAHAVALQWQSNFRQWANEVILVLAESSYAVKDESAASSIPPEKVLNLRYRVSALIDQGRFFFPNQKAEGVGLHKPGAYRGWRHPVLDTLVASERILSGKSLGNFENREVALISMRREFVTSIQNILGPDLQNQEIAALIRSVGAGPGDNLLGGLLPDETSPPPGADGLIRAASGKTWRT